MRFPSEQSLIATASVTPPSDKVLVYVRLGDVKHAPYMLLVILEPGHQQMSDPDLVLGLAVLYEQERNAFTKTFADGNWAAHGFPVHIRDAAPVGLWPAKRLQPGTSGIGDRMLALIAESIAP